MAAATSSSATSESRESNGAGFPHRFQLSLSPVGRFCSSSSTFVNRAGPKHMIRSTSPTRVNLCRPISPTPSVRFSAPPDRSIAVSPRQSRQDNKAIAPTQKKTCMCSPTTHPGSFRCSLHKNTNQNYQQKLAYDRPSRSQLSMRRSAMTNSLVRIGTVEGDLLKRTLATLIRPSSHNLRRRSNFQPQPSRLSTMIKATDCGVVGMADDGKKMAIGGIAQVGGRKLVVNFKERRTFRGAMSKFTRRTLRSAMSIILELFCGDQE